MNYPKIRIKSVPKPSAHSTKLYADQIDRVPGLTPGAKNFLLSKPIPESLASLVAIQFALGLRISEALGITYYDLNKKGLIRVRSLKGSQPLVYPYICPFGWLDKCMSEKINPYDEYNRFYIYRIYKANGIYISTDSNSNDIVTHAPRHLRASEIQAQYHDTELAGKFLRHKSKNSINFYKQ